MKPILTDIETAPVVGAMDFFDPSVLDEVKAPSNWKDPNLIAEHIAAGKQKKITAHLDDAAVQPDLCRIVAIGWWRDEDEAPTSVLCHNEDEERAALLQFWATRGERRIAGYNIAHFDVPIIYRRSLYLGVPTPPMRRGKYSYQNPELDDLFLTLSDDYRQPWRNLAFYVKRLGLDVPHDPTDGAEVPRLVAEGRWDDVGRHNLVDLITERALAAWLGVMSPSAFTLADPSLAIAGEGTAAGS